MAIELGDLGISVTVPEARLVAVHRSHEEPLADPAAALRAALESPTRYPSLKKSLTPDDRVVIAVDDRLPQLPTILGVVVEHLVKAGVTAESITLLCPHNARQGWVDDLPDEIQDVRIEIHDAANRQRLCYLANSAHGQRIYLNRTLIEADQIVVVSGCRTDLLTSYFDGAHLLFPLLGEVDTMRRTAEQYSSDGQEVVWLLGAPFFAHIIEGCGDTVFQVIAGAADTLTDARRCHDQRWGVTASRRAKLVIVPMSGDPNRHDFAELTRAARAGAKLLDTDGQLVLLTRGRPVLGAAADAVRRADDPAASKKLLSKLANSDRAVAGAWLDVVENAHVYVWCGLAADVIESLFATPIANAGEIQRLVDAADSCLILDDGEKVLAQVAGGS
jgi:hypothetical protein